MEFVTSIPVSVAIIKFINRDLHFRFATVCVPQSLVLAPNITNILDAEGIVETLPVALQIDKEVAGQNADKLMWQNTGNSVNIGFVAFVYFRNNGADAIHQSEDDGY